MEVEDQAQAAQVDAQVAAAAAQPTGPAHVGAPGHPPSYEQQQQQLKAEPMVGQQQPTTSGRPTEEEQNGASTKTTLTVDLAAVIEHCRCPICMGIVRNTRAVSACMHRFCKDCIEAWLRTQIENNCPQCRVKFASKRDCKPDPSFDQLIGALFGDIEAFEADALEPSADVLQKARQTGQEIAAAKEAAVAAAKATRLARKQSVVASHPGAAGAGADATVQVGLAPGRAGSFKAAPSAPGGVKRPAAAGAGSDAKRAKGAAAAAAAGPRSASPAGSSQQPGGGSRSRAQAEFGKDPFGRPDKYAPANHEYRGVRKAGAAGWHSKTKKNNREALLGTFPTPAEAARCYDLDRVFQLGNKAQRLNFPNMREAYKQITTETDTSAPDYIIRATAAATAVAERMGPAALVRTTAPRGGIRPRGSSRPGRSGYSESDDDEPAGAEEEESDSDWLYGSADSSGQEEEGEEAERTNSEDGSDHGPSARRRSKSGTSAKQPQSAAQQAAANAQREAAAAAAAEAAAAAAARVRERAAELSARLPLSAAFSALPLTAMVRLSSSRENSVGNVAAAWAMSWLSVPASASMGQLRAAVAAGLTAQLASTAPGVAAISPASVSLAVLNRLEASADAIALLAERDAGGSGGGRGGSGGLLVEDSATIRQLMGALADATDDLSLEYRLSAGAAAALAAAASRPVLKAEKGGAAPAAVVAV